MIELTLLGTIDVRRSDGSLIDSLPRSPKRLALLSWLALEGSIQRRDTILGLLWPEVDQSAGRAALRSLLRLLRMDLGDGVVVNRGKEEIGLAADRVRCDAVVFDEAVKAGEHEKAVELYRGDLLRGFFLPDAPVFEEWLEGERRRRREKALASARALATAAEERGAVTDGVWAARRATSFAPWDEDAAVQLIRLLGVAGSRAGARRAFDVLASHLWEEMGEPPSRRVRDALEEALAASGTANRGNADDVPTPVAGSSAPAMSEGGSTAAAATPAAVSMQPARRASRRRIVGAVTVVAVAAVAALGWWTSRRTDEASAAGDAVREERTVALLPFSVHGPHSIDYLSTGIADLLVADLTIPGVVRPVNARTAGVLGSDDPTSPEGGIRAATLLGAGSFVRGSVVSQEGGLQLVATWTDRAGVTLATASVTVDERRLFAGVDSLVRALLAARYHTPATQIRRVATAATTSLPALRSFVAGEQAYREGRFGDAADAFRSSIARDSAFALANLRLAQSLEWLDRPDLATAALDRADRHRNRLTPRLRYILDARRAYWADQPTDALQAYDSLLGEYPYDAEGLYGRGDLIFHEGPRFGRPMTESRTDFERVLELDPHNGQAVLHLARLASIEERQGDVVRLLGPLDDARGIVGAEAQALTALSRGTAKAQEIRQLSQHPGMQGPNRATVVLRVVQLAGDRPGAMDLTGLLFHVPEPSTRAAGRVLQALLLAGRGSFEAANEALDLAGADLPQLAWTARSAMAIAPVDSVPTLDRRALLDAVPPFPPELSQIPVQPSVQGAFSADIGRYLKGLLLADLGRVDDADAVARAIAEGPYPQLRGEAQAIRAWAAFRSGAVARAARIVHQDRPPLSRAETYFGLGPYMYGEILREAGYPKDALEWYACTEMDLGLDTYYRVLSFLRRGQVLETLGKPDEAAAMYRRFLGRWDDPDPAAVAPEREARRALRHLAGTRAGGSGGPGR